MYYSSSIQLFLFNLFFKKLQKKSNYYKEWHVDGTFECAPRHFVQLFTVQIIVKGIKIYKFGKKKILF